MKPYGIFLFLFIMGLCSCASEPIAKPKYIAEENAIHLYIKADPRLNEYSGESHSLHLCVYQLKSQNGFNCFTQSKEGIYQLLDESCSFSHGSVVESNRKCEIPQGIVVWSNRYTIRPGEKSEYIVDRAEEARYIAFVAGYSSLKEKGIVRFIEIPVIEVKESTGWFSSKKYLKPDMLHLELILGSDQIKRIEKKQEK